MSGPGVDYFLPALVSVILLTVYMESIDDEVEEERGSVVPLLLKTGRNLNQKQALLIPLTVWSGVEQAFMMSVFSGKLLFKLSPNNVLLLD